MTQPYFPSYVLFNRQPSLHKMSMMAHRVKLMSYSSQYLFISWILGWNADMLPSLSSQPLCVSRMRTPVSWALNSFVARLPIMPISMAMR